MYDDMQLSRGCFRFTVTLANHHDSWHNYSDVLKLLPPGRMSEKDLLHKRYLAIVASYPGPTQLFQVSACNIEKLGRAWVRGYSYSNMLHLVDTFARSLKHPVSMD